MQPKKHPLSLIQLPDDAVSVGYKQTNQFKYEQVFCSQSNNFTGTELQFLKAGLAYEYFQAGAHTRVSF